MESDESPKNPSSNASPRSPTKRPTLKTIATMSGLGLTTVSKALKDAPDISEKTKTRVRLIADQIGYQPDRAGQRLRTGKTNTLSLIIDTEETVSELASQLIIGISRQLENTAYTLSVTPYSALRDDPIQPVRRVVETRAADGVIISQIQPLDHRLTYLLKEGMPFVTHGRSDMTQPHAFVDFDNTRFARDAVELLQRKGRKHLALVDPPAELTYGRLMQEGFQQGILESGLLQCPLTGVRLDSPIAEIAKQTNAALMRPNPPDGFVCGSVSATAGVISGIETAGLKVGKQVDIVAKQTTSNFLRWLGKPVFSINENFIEAGSHLAASLVAVIDGAPIENHQTINYPDAWGELVIKPS